MGPELKALVRDPIGWEDCSSFPHRAQGEHPICGDRLAFGVETKGDTLARLAFQATACPACMAVASCAVRVYRQGPVPLGPPFEALRQELERLGGLAPFERHALSLVEDVLERALLGIEENQE